MHVLMAGNFWQDNGSSIIRNITDRHLSVH